MLSIIISRDCEAVFIESTASLGVINKKKKIHIYSLSSFRVKIINEKHNISAKIVKNNFYIDIEILVVSRDINLT